MLRKRYTIVIKATFVALVVSSLFFGSYTLYLYYGTKLALNNLRIELSDVKFLDESEKRALLELEFKNSYWIDLKMKYVSLQLEVNNNPVGATQQGYVSPVVIPSRSTVKLNFSVPISGKVEMSKNNLYILIFRIVFITPFSENAEINGRISKVI